MCHNANENVGNKQSSFVMAGKRAFDVSDDRPRFVNDDEPFQRFVSVCFHFFFPKFDLKNQTLHKYTS